MTIIIFFLLTLSIVLNLYLVKTVKQHEVLLEKHANQIFTLTLIAKVLGKSKKKSGSNSF
jgi:hypothetical protein